MMAASLSPAISRVQIVRLYKDLIRYSNQLILTDKQYYLRRVKDEFRKNKDLTQESDITFYYKKGLSFLSKKRLI